MQISPKSIGGSVVLFSAFAVLAADDLTSLVADRAAIEQVYYHHRLGDKPPFEQTIPPATLKGLVRLDLNKEAALKKAYGVTITPAQLAAEVQRINTTTQSPEMLTEIKAGLDQDPEKFANAFAKPILVERELRRRFENNDALHAATRREMERVRERLLAEKPPDSVTASRQSAAISPPTSGDSSGKESAALSRDAATPKPLAERRLARLKQAHSNEVSETTWQLGVRPEEKPTAPTTDDIEIKKRFGAGAQILSSPNTGPDKERMIYFEDLPAELQKVLRVQLRRVGDVSAVIETPGGFLLYLAKEKSAETLAVAVLSLGKRSYEEWVAEQSKGKP